MAETRVVPDVPRRDDAFLVDGVRVCPLADNTTACACWWVVSGRPNTSRPAGLISLTEREPETSVGEGTACVCSPPPELWGKGA